MCGDVTDDTLHTYQLATASTMQKAVRVAPGQRVPRRVVITYFVVVVVVAMSASKQ